MPSLSKSRLIIIGAIIFVVLFFILLFTGIVPGLRTDRAPALQLTIWGVFDSEETIKGLASLVGSQYEITYRQFPIQTYETDLINALAGGRGPDIFMIHNTWLPKHFDKLSPINETQVSITDFRNAFPTVVEQNFAPDGFIYASPLYLDTLALIYNRDILDTAGVALPPTTWTELQNVIPGLRTIDSSGKLIRAAAAIGGSASSVNRATDLLSALFLQAGVTMVSSDFSRAEFSNEGGPLVEFYTKFANPGNSFYTWNDGFANSIDGFAEEKVAMIFNYGHQIENIKAKNPFLNIGIAPLPQFEGSSSKVDYANYWGLAVSNAFWNPSGAWSFILSATANPQIMTAYTESTGRLPALRSLIAQKLSDPQLAVFASAALSARSWPQIDNTEVEKAFSKMTTDITGGKSTISKALQEAENTISALMAQKRASF